jgi:Na+-translocating ferredoxin:NAD+ oxidoreductase RnfD subunit
MGPKTMRNAPRKNKGSLTSDTGIGILVLIIHTHETVQEHTEDGLTLANMTVTLPP